MLKKIFGISSVGQLHKVYGKDNHTVISESEGYTKELQQKNDLLHEYQMLLHALGFDVEAINKTIQDGGLDGGIGGMPYKLMALSALRFHRDFSRTHFSERGIEESNRFLDSLLMENSGCSRFSDLPGCCQTLRTTAKKRD